MIDPLLHWTLCLPLALLLFLAARQKQADGAHFSAQLDAYEVLPAALVPLVARLLPVVEAALAALLLIPATRQSAALAAAALLLVYAAGMGINLLRGRDDIDCGCGGKPQVISGWLVLRNLLLAFAAALCAQPAAVRELGWQDIVLLAVFVPVLALTYAMAEQLIGNHSVLKQWGRSVG